MPNYRQDSQRADAVQPPGTTTASCAPTGQGGHPQQHHGNADRYLQLADEDLVLALTSGKRLASDSRQRECGEGAEHRASQEGKPGTGATLRKKDEDSG